MKVDFDTQYSPKFNANVSPKFVELMRKTINSGENRLKNNYRLNSKLEEFANYGYNDYTIELHKKYIGYGSEFALIAVKDGDSFEKGIFIDKKNSFKQAMQKFLNLEKREFHSKMHKRRRYLP